MEAASAISTKALRWRRSTRRIGVAMSAGLSPAVATW
jgi:hypothetical protein